MTSELSQAIKQLVQERGIPEDLVMSTIENFLLAAYKKKYGVVDNAVVRFSDDGQEVTLFAKKKIVLDDDLDDPVYEMPLSEALELNEECEVGDELLIEINPKEFDRVSVQSAKQKARQSLREIQKDTLYSEFKDKVGEMIIGYYQRERNGNIYVDLGKTEGILPKKYQSPREVYHPNDRIKALIYEVVKTPTGLQIVLSRNHAEFVKKIFELEVPEIYDKTIEISKIVREPGYRTKIAVRSTREDVDPVGACVGLKGVRIQAVVRELEGEKIDILRYSLDARSFIKNALSPAEVNQVIILDEAKKLSLAIVPDAQFSLAIGKQGLNVRLANRLTDWNIDVKTESQFAEMDISAEAKRAVSALFGEPEEEIQKISELPGIPPRLVEILERDKITDIESLVALTPEQLAALEGITAEDIQTIHKIIEENVEIVEEEPAAEGGFAAAEGGFAATEGGSDALEPAEAGFTASAEAEGAEETAVEGGLAAAETGEAATAEAEAQPELETQGEPQAAPAAAAAAPAEAPEEVVEEETYECPECGSAVTPDMATCPNCGVGLTFEDSPEDAAGEPGAK
ncbi:MAG TPA: transcription termination factor NusA [Spirochaetia bacterium]|nr:transcription termination factor NusA [Spirochaetia bacterium]